MNGSKYAIPSEEEWLNQIMSRFGQMEEVETATLDERRTEM